MVAESGKRRVGDAAARTGDEFAEVLAALVAETAAVAVGNTTLSAVDHSDHSSVRLLATIITKGPPSPPHANAPDIPTRS